ncbi:PREDICTED: protein AIR1 [Nelumbo nucifera]|uniref:Protein AIR1 n=2 Tax=Nelumbo nucifera TaxID=4432 RepID=A0A1U8A1E0_NELNU|nr:PREDICTED: protein AIR1 [Nelumbo nucifera]DAD18882.1 TPA_asm: hypothetical protein HUJ06_020345 [Nelumbo nucifera]
MANQRQRLARKRYRTAHPELCAKPEPTAPKDPSKKKKKKYKFKRKAGENDGPKTLKTSKNSTFRKHPLRVPGMKPGEGCFICKADNHIAKLCPQKTQWEKHKICLLCRQRGHSLKNCPNKSDEINDKKLCYNCGEYGHSLSKCPQPLQDGGAKFANCFVCGEHGHLSKNCPKNTHGIYPKGGSCKICGGITHLAKNCPNKDDRGLTAANVAENKSSAQVTKFGSGDDLDDFGDICMEEDSNEGKKRASSKSKANSTSGVEVENNSNVKAKKKQGAKVVNFMG